MDDSPMNEARYRFGTCGYRRRSWAKPCGRPLYLVGHGDGVKACRVHDRHPDLPPMSDDDRVREATLDFMETLGFFYVGSWMFRHDD